MRTKKKIGRLKKETWTFMKGSWTCKWNDFNDSDSTIRCPHCSTIIGDVYHSVNVIKDGKKIKKEFIQHDKCGVMLCLVR